MHAGQLLTDQPDRLHRGQAVFTVLLDAGGNRQGQGVVEDLMGRNAEFDGIAVGPLGNGQLALGGAGHALLIDRAHHHAGAIAAGQLQHFEEALIAVFVVGGVEDALAAGHLEAGFHLLPLGGVEHQRQVDVRHQTAHQLAHVALAIAPHIVDVDVEHVGVLLHLAAGHGHQAIPVLLRQQFADLLAATGVEALTNDQEGIVLLVGGDPVNGAGGGFKTQGRPRSARISCALGTPHRPGGRRELLGQLRQGGDVGGGGATAPPDHLHPQVLHKVHQLHLHFGGGEPVVGHTADVFRQAGVGDAAHHKRAVLAEVAHVLLHLLGAGGAVEAEHIDGERLQNRHHCGDVGTHEHCAGGFHGDAHHQGPTLAGALEGLLNALQCRLDLQHVLAGLHDEQIDVAGDQSLRLFREGVAQLVKADVPQGGQLGGGPHRAGNKAGLLRGAVRVSHLARQFGGPFVDGKGLVLQVVFRQHRRGRPEGVGLDHIAAGIQELPVHRLHRIRAGEHQVFVAALQGRTAEIFGAEVHLLERGAGGPVEHQNRRPRAMQPLEKTDALGAGAVGH